MALYFMERVAHHLGVRFEGIGEADMRGWSAGTGLNFRIRKLGLTGLLGHLRARQSPRHR